jgi:hypothetical protein
MIYLKITMGEDLKEAIVSSLQTSQLYCVGCP